MFKGFSFIKESFSLITKDADLIKPPIYSIFVGVFFTIVSGIVLFFLRSMIPAELFYILAFLVLLADYYISYFFTGMTAFLVYDYFKDGDATMSEVWAAVKKNAATIFYLSIISAIVKVITSILRNREERDRNIASGLSVMIVGFIESAWTIATYFIIPAIVIEDRGLKGAVERATCIIKRNLLPIGVGEIAVGLVTGILSFIGIIIAIFIGVMLFSVTGGAAAGALVAILVVAILIILVIALSMYITTAYHTCLFLWARNVETASPGVTGMIKPPAPIASALGV
ncbi:membrane hypothetical protein [Candidatus Methanoperedens nitroreducens]|uniref:Uncharacterized protein n=1 Tax=Candidatus Methanoperedens nitratireducens TaxID=1392998 RepID=A0A284VNM1_9EURY|nr:membrane hypothetical protein [Candidatus Methanoperedens nitroreducens]